MSSGYVMRIACCVRCTEHAIRNTAWHVAFKLLFTLEC